MDDPPLASLPSCISYAYSLKIKRAFAAPRLTHQFKLEWSWPAASCTVSPASPEKMDASTSPNYKPVSTVLEKENVKSRDIASPSGSPTCADPMSASPLSTDVGIATEETPTHQFQGETTILSMSGDPHPTTRNVYGVHGAASQTSHLQRVALILSAGYRFYIPLKALATPEHHADTSSTTYWRVVLKPPRDSPDAVVPFCAEVVVGELASIEWLVKQQKEAQPPPSTRCLGGPITKNHADTTKSHWAPLHHSPAKLPVQSFFFHSIPYKLMWLTNVPNRILVSLPCEERLVTLDVPHRLPPEAGGGYVVGQTKPVARQPSHAFQLPRGVVPLDLAEIYARPFVAIGTYEHGALIYYLNLSTGAVEYAVRHISICGSGSSIFPITRLAAVFPLPYPRSGNPNIAGGHARPLFKWKNRAEHIASLAEGALFCCSAFDPQPLLAKQLNLKDAIIENFSVGRVTENVICVGSQIDPHVGTLFSTVTQGLSRLVVYPEERPASGKGSARSHSGSISCEEVCGGQISDEEHGRGVHKVLRTRELDRVLALRAEFSQQHQCSISERVPPLICAIHGKNTALGKIIRLAEGATVFESARKYELKGKPIYGLSSKHWMPAVTAGNELLLLNRVITKYIVISTFHLVLPSYAQKNSKPHRPCGVDASDIVKVENSADDENDAPFRNPAQRAQPQKAPDDKLKEPVVPNEMEDLCTGLVTLSAGNGWLCVAAAHHRNWITILSYLGEAECNNRKK
ncbi:unnamed protein product [Phytomonas sp. EM1]|nr:unnamed protein product [Phytomonas sp. EM1]|eukprot:CCW63228.1 unnamed protein product [Phytomonas sp. isolate EM1]